jgi:phosphate transport system permease protein
MTALTTRPGPPAAASLRDDSGRSLGRHHHLAVLALVVVGTLLLFAVTPLQGRAGFGVVVVLLYAAVSTAFSFAREGRRRAQDRLLTLSVHAAVLAALVPLVAVLGYTVNRGSKKLSASFLDHSLRGIGPFDTNGGEYHAIVGTLEQVLLTIVIAVPAGLLVSIYITEYGRGPLAATIRFVVDVMTGIPSIVAGLFIYAFWVLGLKQGFSGLAAALSLAILMLPVVVRASEEMIRLVPDELREASYALGIPTYTTILRVVLPTASAGITTGIMLAVARVTGETAPLLLTSYIAPAINNNVFSGKQAALPTYIFDQAQQGREINFDRAWAAALTLIVVVLVLYASARLLTRRNTLARR